MATRTNSTKKTNYLVNWATVWGLIFFAIALDLYVNYDEQKKGKETYRSQYEAKASEADSLRAVKSELERQLFEMKATRGSESTGSVARPDNEKTVLASTDVVN
ncbi:hypothetical protein ACO2Q8_25625 [Larkinella sp. VNQ87]|uniref:hypothetical protein n=1 Tax=Larkinella sp. VNQ87 TaxID=3400921 RepID=UPI003C0836C6